MLLLKFTSKGCKYKRDIQFFITRCDIDEFHLYLKYKVPYLGWSKTCVGSTFYLFIDLCFNFSMDVNVAFVAFDFDTLTDRKWPQRTSWSIKPTLNRQWLGALHQPIDEQLLVDEQMMVSNDTQFM